jgi:hypothetical protein
VWAEVVQRLAEYRNAVLTGRDADGYPLSVRCQPVPDHAAQVLRLPTAPHLSIQPGPASLLCYWHDEQLWNQRSFLVRGRLERQGEDWIFRPIQAVPGVGYGGLLGLMRFALGARRQAGRYLAVRHLPRPTLPWSEIIAVKKRAKQPDGSGSLS